jgi:hypothetical protein
MPDLSLLESTVQLEISGGKEHSGNEELLRRWKPGGQ